MGVGLSSQVMQRAVALSTWEALSMVIFMMWCLLLTAPLGQIGIPMVCPSKDTLSGTSFAHRLLDLGGLRSFLLQARLAAHCLHFLRAQSCVQTLHCLLGALL